MKASHFISHNIYFNKFAHDISFGTLAHQFTVHHDSKHQRLLRSSISGFVKIHKLRECKSHPGGIQYNFETFEVITAARSTSR